MFERSFKNVLGLILKTVYDKVAIRSYVTKEEGRTRGPFYGGKKDMFDSNFTKAKLWSWQYELFKIMTGENKEILKDRKVILVQDCCGNTGKSWFQKWLRVGQKSLLTKSLPISSVDRLISAVHILNKTYDVDAYLIDLTRTQGKDQSYNDLFAAKDKNCVEQLLNFTSKLKNKFTYIIQKGNQTVVFICSKETMVGILVF